MNKRLQKLVVSGLCAVFCLSSVNGAAAQTASRPQTFATEAQSAGTTASAHKDETVYVLTGADGAVQKIIVSDWIQNASGSALLSDRSELSDIENVKGDESFANGEDGSKIWDAQGNDVYYQGCADKELPIGLTVTYKLDGKTMSAEEIAGKSGRVTIRFDYENRQYETVEIAGEKERIYVPFVLLTGMVLDSDSFRNVEVVNGKRINDGDHTFVVGLAFPGMQENLAFSKDKLEIPDYLEVTADAVNFEFGMTITIATNEVFNELDMEELEATDFSGSLDQLTDAMTQLTDGSAALYDGLCALLEKSGELTAGVGQLATGTQTLKEGTDSLTKGAAELYEGASELSDGLSELSENSATLNNGAAQVFSSLLSTATAQIREAGVSVPNLTIGNYSDVLTEVISSLDKNAVYRQALEKVTATVEAKRPEIETAVTAAVREQVAEQVTAAVQTEVQSAVTAAVREQVATQAIQEATGMSLEAYNAAVAENKISAEIQAAVEAAIDSQMTSESAQSLIQSETSAKMASAEVQTLLAQNIDAQMQSSDVQTLISQNVELQVAQAISDAMASDEVQAQLSAASEGAKSIITLKTSLDSYNVFYQGLLAYTSGVDSAADGSCQLLSGTAELKDGAIQLQDGTTELYNGVLTLQESIPALTDGVTQLRDGALELSDGLKQLNEEGVQKLLDALDENLGDMVERIQAMKDVCAHYQNFSGLENGMSGQVKFIFRTEAVQAD